MRFEIPPLANAIRILGVLWLVTWPIYYLFWSDGLRSAVSIKTAVGTLLIPAVLAFGVAWWLDRAPATAQDVLAARDNRGEPAIGQK